MRIALDMDGFLCEFTLAFTQLAAQLGLVGEPHSSQDQPTWDFKFNVKPVWDLVDRTPNWWMTLQPTFGADDLAALNRLIEEHQVHIITNRKTIPGLTGYSAREQVYHWLASVGVLGIRMQDIHTGTHRGDKGKLAAQLGIHIAGDDHTPNLRDYRDHGVHAVALDWPYNQDWRGPRVHSVMTFCAYVKFYHDNFDWVDARRVYLTPEGERAAEA